MVSWAGSMIQRIDPHHAHVYSQRREQRSSTGWRGEREGEKESVSCELEIKRERLSGGQQR